VAEVEDGLADFRQLARFNGETTVGLGIVKVANTNTVAITETVLARLENEIRPQLPPGMRITVVSNDAVFILEIVNSLKEHLIEGTLLASLVVWFFLRSLRSTLIIALAIPVSLMGAIAVIYFFGYTLNSLTLLALLLLIGVVVDDAIVVLENIFRHREEIDPDPVAAAVNGSREVVFAVIAATLSLVSIFAPVIFLSGIIGQFFRSFAVVVTFGVVVSLFVSLTLTPMLCSRYLKVEKQHGAHLPPARRLLRRHGAALPRLLDGAGHRWKVVALTLATVASSVFFFASIGKTFTPEQDEGRFLVRLRAPLGSSIEYTDSRLRMVEDILNRHKEIVTEFALIGFGSAGQVNQGLVVVRMAPRGERTLRQQDLLPMLRKELAAIPGAFVFAAPYPIVGGQRGEPLQFVLAGENLQEVGRLSRELQQRLAQVAGIGRLDTDLQLDLPQLVFQPDRARIAAAQLSSQDVALAVNMLTGGIDIAKFNDEPGDGQRYDIRVKGREGEFTQPSDLSKIWLRAKDGKLVRLDSVASFAERLGPAVIGRFDLQYAATFYASPTIPLGEAVAKLREVAAEILPAGYQVKLVGQAEEFGKTQKYMTFAFVAGAGAALHGARQPVQLLPAAGHHHAGAAAGHHRRRGGAVADRADAQHLLDDRPGAADRPGGEELDPAGRPRQPAPRGRPGGRRRAARRLPDAHAAGADDLRHHHPRPLPGRAGPRRRRGDQPAAVHRRHRRHDLLDAADPGGGAGGVFAGGRPARTAGVKKRRPQAPFSGPPGLNACGRDPWSPAPRGRAPRP
jgi:HAE1 family hydrophobic/amphiphilic exporter-1